MVYTLLNVFREGANVLRLGFDESGLHSCAGAGQAFSGSLRILLPLVFHIWRSRCRELGNVAFAVIVVWVQ